MVSPVRAEAKAPAAVQERRRRKAVPLGIQIRALAPVIVFGALFLVLTLFFVWLPMQRQLAVDPSPVIRAVLSAQLFRVGLWVLTFLLISGGVAATIALLHARRVAAAVADVREHLARLAVGDPEAIALNQGAELRELEAPYNAVVSRFDHGKRGNLEMLRLLHRNLEGILQRSRDDKLKDADLRESIAILLRDIDSEINKLQMKA